jgi:hypothetical protein
MLGSRRLGVIKELESLLILCITVFRAVTENTTRIYTKPTVIHYHRKSMVFDLLQLNTITKISPHHTFLSTSSPHQTPLPISAPPTTHQPEPKETPPRFTLFELAPPL